MRLSGDGLRQLDEEDLLNLPGDVLQHLSVTLLNDLN